MFIERSWDYGRHWSVYRYFAFDCKKSFPNVQLGPQKKINDVICEEKYSKVEPSTEGEVDLCLFLYETVTIRKVLQQEILNKYTCKI